MDGYATTALIRQRDSQRTRVPIVALSAHDAGTYRAACLEAGMDDMLEQTLYIGRLRAAAAPLGAPRLAKRRAARVAAAEPLAPELTAVDTQAVASLRNLRGAGGTELYSKLIALFRTGSAESLAALDGALSSADLPAAAALCHKLKASAANVGALLFSRELGRLEKACEAKKYRRGAAPACTRAQRLPLTAGPAGEADTKGERVTTITHKPAIAIVADDEDLGRLLLSEAVAQLGLVVSAHDNGSAALEVALEQNLAIVLLDVDMPGQDGYAVCRRLRAEPRFANVPIVMVTGHEDSAAIDLAFEAGATDFIAKPVNWALLPPAPELHPAQCRRGRTHRTPGVLRSFDRVAEPPALHAKRRTSVHRGGRNR